MCLHTNQVDLWWWKILQFFQKLLCSYNISPNSSSMTPSFFSNWYNQYQLFLNQQHLLALAPKIHLLGISDRIVYCLWEQSLSIPNRPQAWGANMKWIWKVSMYVNTWGNEYYDDDNMTNPWFRKHANYCTHQRLLHNVVGFINYFIGFITQ
jgi:hypothetical protein